MTKKDYEAIAAVIKKVMNCSYPEIQNRKSTLYMMIGEIGVVFGKDNPEYQHQRFVKACGNYPK